jgi:hypothetical protein
VAAAPPPRKFVPVVEGYSEYRHSQFLEQSVVMAQLGRKATETRFGSMILKKDFKEKPATNIALTVRWEDHAEQHASRVIILFRCAYVGATVRRDHVDNRVFGHRQPSAVDLDLIMVANHSALRWAAIILAATRRPVLAFERGIELLMPLVVVDPIMSVLCRSA